MNDDSRGRSRNGIASAGEAAREPYRVLCAGPSISGSAKWHFGAVPGGAFTTLHGAENRSLAVRAPTRQPRAELRIDHSLDSIQPLAGSRYATLRNSTTGACLSPATLDTMSRSSHPGSLTEWPTCPTMARTHEGRRYTEKQPSWPACLDDPNALHLQTMQPPKAHVHNGRLVLDEPTDLPEGEVVEQMPLDAMLADGVDDLDDQEREQLHESLRESIRQMKTGETLDGAAALAELRAHR